jgi:hypothetical protein
VREKAKGMGARERERERERERGGDKAATIQLFLLIYKLHYKEQGGGRRVSAL